MLNVSPRRLPYQPEQYKEVISAPLNLALSNVIKVFVSTGELLFIQPLSVLVYVCTVGYLGCKRIMNLNPSKTESKRVRMCEMDGLFSFQSQRAGICHPFAKRVSTVLLSSVLLNFHVCFYMTYGDVRSCGAAQRCRCEKQNRCQICQDMDKRN